uniref:Large ribosomal subunit protein P2 n=1 Tax=Rhipicephalus microplus TaxID=6941 RepID=A0A6G4ZZG5_RHIMP
MRYVAAYLLASMGGNKDPSAADIEKILGSVGIESDSERLKKVISELKGKTVDEVIAKGKEKLATMPSGGGAAAAAAPAPAAAAGGGGGASGSRQRWRLHKNVSPKVVQVLCQFVGTVFSITTTLSLFNLSVISRF